MRKILTALAALFLSTALRAQHSDESAWIRNHYTKQEAYIPMRDGVKLYTAIYSPKDNSHPYPFLMMRTPYSCAPYGPSQYPSRLGPDKLLMKEGYIIVYQDVRGRYKSGGAFKEMTPYIAQKRSANEVDESSDTYDTIDWLLKHIRNNNGKAGIWGISYPGFYASSSLPGAHPALKAVSPQAPMSDEFMGDDANHNGAFFLLDNFDFMNYFGGQIAGDSESYRPVFSVDYQDAYRFYLQMGPLKNTQSPLYFDHKVPIWNQYLEHTTYDAYWKSRNIRPHLKEVRPATLIVGGWFDAEDLFGTLHTYQAIEAQNPDNRNCLVMGPWTHGAWARDRWDHFATYRFDPGINDFFREKIETKFFDYYLKGEGNIHFPEALIYETGSDRWQSFDHWPPAAARPVEYYFGEKNSLSTTPPQQPDSYDTYLSDPASPVPYTKGRFKDRNNDYMAEDQRFAAKRPDVLFYQTGPLSSDLTLAGPVTADLYISTTGTDADFIVKLIDVLPDSASGAGNGMQRLVRAEVMRGKFRDGFAVPQPFVPGAITPVYFQLNDIAHTFKKGHRIMVQIQSSWFPLVDRNPQTFTDIDTCDEPAFRKATIRVYHETGHGSRVVLPVLQ